MSRSSYSYEDERDQVTYNYESEFSEDEDFDQFPDVDVQTSTTSKNVQRDLHVDLWSEEEFDEEEEFEEESEPEETREEYLRRQNEIHAEMLAGLSVLEGKLNWCNNPVQVVAEDLKLEKLKIDKPKFPYVSRQQFGKATQQNSPVVFLHNKRTSWDVEKNGLRFTSHPSITLRSNCKFFEQYGRCQFGPKCLFFHPTKTQKENCKFFLQYGRCRYRDTCKFLHPQNEAKQQDKIEPSVVVKNTGKETPVAVVKPQPKVAQPGGAAIQIGNKPEQCPAGNKCVNKQCSFFHTISRHNSPQVAPGPNFCKHGSGCNRMETCKFIHPFKNMVHHYDQHIQRQQHLTREQDQTREQITKKMWLCKKEFQITKDSISIKNECRFGINCVFAHSKEEVLQMVEHCKNGETCKNVSLIFKQDENGKKIRRYEVVQNKKCFRIHPKERVVDYIKRTQS